MPSRQKAATLLALVLLSAPLTAVAQTTPEDTNPFNAGCGTRHCNTTTTAPSAVAPAAMQATPTAAISGIPALDRAHSLATSILDALANALRVGPARLASILHAVGDIVEPYGQRLNRTFVRGTSLLAAAASPNISRNENDTLSSAATYPRTTQAPSPTGGRVLAATATSPAAVPTAYPVTVSAPQVAATASVSPSFLAQFSQFLQSFSAYISQQQGSEAYPHYGGYIPQTNSSFDSGHVADNTAITAPVITGGTISGANVSGYLPLSGGTLTGTLSGTDLTLSGNLTAGALSVAGLSSGGALLAPYFNATSSTATSTFSGNVLVNGNSFLATTTVTGALTVNGNTNITEGGQLTVGDKIISPGEIGLGTSTPSAKLAIQSTNPSQTSLLIVGTTTQASPLLDIFSNAGASFLRIAADGNTGIGTTTPGSLLSLGGIANFTTATSTFYSTGGISLAAGCFAIAGNCLSLSDISGYSAAQLIAAGFSTTSADAWKSTRSFFATSSTDFWLTTKTTDALAQGSTNKYYATSLFATDLAATTTSALSEGSNLYYTANRVAGVIAGTTTDALAEGSSRLYFTNARADARINATTTIGTLTSAPNLATLSTSLTGFLKATAGALSTSLADLAADVTGILPVSNGGTGWSSLASGAIPYGNGSSALATSSALSFDGTKLIVTYASSTAFTTSGALFAGLGQFTNTSGTTTIASGQGFTIGGSQFVLQQGSGNVGIGTAIPFTNLHVVGNIAAYSSVQTSAGSPVGASIYLGDGAWIGSNYTTAPGISAIYNATYGVAGDLAFYRYNGLRSEAMRIDGSGNVGIGTTTPGSKLTVSGGAIVLDNNQPYKIADVGGAARSILQLTNGDVVNIQNNSGGDGGPITFNPLSGGLEAGRFDASGNFGIGTSAPTNRLAVDKAAITAATATTYHTAVNISGTTYLTTGADTNYAYLQSWQNKPLYLNSQGNNVIFGSGNVGIGTTSPLSQLTLAGNSTGITFTDPNNLIGSNIYYSGGFKYYDNGYGSALKLGPDGSLIYYQAGYNSSGANAAAALSQPFTINASGNVGIASTSPNAKLAIVGSATYAGQANVAAIIGAGTVADLLLGSTNGNAPFIASQGASPLLLYTNAAERMRIDSSGNVGIGTTTPTAQLSTTGTVRFSNFGAGTLTTDASGNLSVSSDERLKNIDGAFTRGLADIQKINSISYHWKPTSGLDTKTQYSGFSAQNVQDAIPEAVGSSTNGYLTLQDRPILAAAINAIKELSAKLDTLVAAVSGFAERFTSRELIATSRLCIGNSDGSTVCITGDQLAALLGASGQSYTITSGNQSTSPLLSATSSPATSTPSVVEQQATSTPPTDIQATSTSGTTSQGAVDFGTLPPNNDNPFNSPATSTPANDNTTTTNLSLAS